MRPDPLDDAVRVPGEPSPDDQLDEQFREYRRTGERALRNELIEAHRWLAVVCARRFQRRGEPLEDLVQVGMIGVLKAVERFDPSYGVPFRSFASPTVMGELRRHFRDTTWRVKVPRRIQELHLEVAAATDRLHHALGRSPTPQDLADCLHVSVEDILDALSAGANYRALPLAPPGSDEKEDSEGEAPALRVWDPGFADIAERDRLRQLLERLPNRERTIVFLRFYRNRTQSEIAEEVGLSQVHVSRLLRRSLEQLRRAAASERSAGEDQAGGEG